jgi:GNAT superfamily N-acetyltransferase
METKCDIKLVVCILDRVTREQILNLLADLTTNGRLITKMQDFCFEIVWFESQRQAIDCVRHHIAAGDKRAALLLFDIPTDSVTGHRAVDSCGLPDWDEEVRNEIKTKCGTIAIMSSPRRLRDIDRVIGRSVKSEQLLDALLLVTDRLAYTAVPLKRTLSDEPELRLIRRQHELLDYFKFRYRIYKIMGYLDEETEGATSQMEINWCDRISLHIGAYVPIGEQRDSLVGTARVVVGTTSDTYKRSVLLTSYDQCVTALASQDPILKQALSKGVLPLQLPIFHSQRLFSIFHEALIRKEVCGELSRVIVTENYRGTGLSSRLVEFAVAEAAKIGVSRMFLECLAIHESLYRRLGFKRIEATSGTVISVNQTMIAMELCRPLGLRIARGA